MSFCTPAEEPQDSLEAEMCDNLCGVLARFYSNNEGFLNNPSVIFYLEANELCMFARGRDKCSVCGGCLNKFAD